MQQGRAVRGPEVQIRAGVQELLDDGFIFPVDGEAERAVRLAIAVIDVGSPFDQVFYQLAVLTHGSDPKGSAVIAVTRVDFSPRLD